MEIFDKTQIEAIKNMAASGDVAGAQALIIEGLTSKIGGLAEAMGETTSGQWEIFKNRLGEIGETIGTALLPTLGLLIDKIEENLPLIEQWAGRIAEFFNSDQFSGFIDSVGNFIGDVSNAMATGDWSVVLDKVDTFIANLLQRMSNAVIEWINAGGPDELTEKVTSWVNDLGDSEAFRSKAITAATALVGVLVEAFLMIDWADISNTIDEKFADSIEKTDWKKSGEALIQSIKNIFSGVTLDKSILPDDWLLAVISPGLWALRNFLKESATAKAVIEAVKDFGRGIIAAIKDIFGISSPSTVFAEIGKELVQGLISGWKNTFELFMGILTGDLARISNLFQNNGINVGVQGDSSSLNSGGGTTGGRSTGGTLAGGTTRQAVNNYYYGPVYFGAAGEPGAYYDCPSPNPIITATAGGVSGGRSAVR
jgi:hypothetical protein